MPSPRRSLWRLQPLPPAYRGHPGPREEKSEEKKRGGDITPIRLRRRLHRPPRPAGPLAASPARPSRPSPAGPAAVCPAPPSCPSLHFSPRGEAKCVRVTRHESRPLWPFSSRWVRKGRTTKKRRQDRRTRRLVTASMPATSHYCLFTSVHYCSALFGEVGGVPLSKCPRTVRRGILVTSRQHAGSRCNSAR